MKYFQARIIQTTVPDAVKEDAVYYANVALNMFGLTRDEIAVQIKGLIKRRYRNTYGHCDCVIVDQTVSDDTLVKKCSSQIRYYCNQHYLCFALKGVKIGLLWNGQNRYDYDDD